MRRLLIRSLTVAVAVLLGVYLFIFGRGYTLILDNNAVDLGGTRYPAPAAAEIVVDRRGGIEIFARERDTISLKGPFHRVELRVMDRGGKVLSTVSRNFTLTGSPTHELLVAPLAAGAAGFIREFSDEPLLSAPVPAGSPGEGPVPAPAPAGAGGPSPGGTGP